MLLKSLRLCSSSFLPKTFVRHLNMGKYVLTGVDGDLGHRAADYAITIAEPGQQLVFTTPFLDKIPKDRLERWEKAGVQLEYASYDDVPSLEKAFKDADVVYLISTWLIGNIRRRQHRQAIKVASEVGVKRLCYTSFIGAQIAENTPLVASDHRDTEKAIYESGLAWNIQRNNFYSDNYFSFLFPMVHNVCGDKWYWNSEGTPSGFVAKDDCARVLGALLLGKGKVNTVYTVTGPELVSDFTIPAMVKEKTGWECEIVSRTDDQLYEYWSGRGVPKTVEGDFSKSPIPLCCDDLITNTAEIRNGTMKVLSNDVETLTGRKPLSVKEVMEQYIDSLPKGK